MNELETAYARIGRLTTAIETVAQERAAALSVILALKSGELGLDELVVEGEAIRIERKQPRSISEEAEGLVRSEGGGTKRRVRSSKGGVSKS